MERLKEMFWLAVGIALIVVLPIIFLLAYFMFVGNAWMFT